MSQGIKSITLMLSPYFVIKILKFQPDSVGIKEGRTELKGGQERWWR